MDDLRNEVENNGEGWDTAKQDVCASLSTAVGEQEQAPTWEPLDDGEALHDYLRDLVHLAYSDTILRKLAEVRDELGTANTNLDTRTTERDETQTETALVRNVLADVWWEL